MKISVTKLRTDLYRIVDQVIESGVPVEIERNGQVVKLVPSVKKSKLANLKTHPNVINGDPDDIIHVNWNEHWHEDENT